MHEYWDGLSGSEEESFDSGSNADESSSEKGIAKSNWEGIPFEYPRLKLDGPAFRLLRLHKGTGPHISGYLFKT